MAVRRIKFGGYIAPQQQVVLAVASHVSHHGLARFGKIRAAAAEGALLEDLPAVGRDQLVPGVEDHQVQVVLRSFKEYQVLAAIVVQVPGDHIRQVPVLDRRFVAVEFGQFPDLPCQRQARDGIQTHKRNRIGLAASEG